MTNQGNGNELIPPSWLTCVYFTDILDKEYGPANYTVETFKVENAVEKGENFTSVLLRVIIDLKLKGREINKKTTSYIVKTEMPNQHKSDDIFNDLKIFDKEVEMYSQILPKFENLFVSAGLENIRFAPKYLKSSLEPENVLVMEDLRRHKFSTIKRQDGLNLEQTRLVLSKLAKFHAASAVIQERDGEYSDKFLHGIFTLNYGKIYDKTLASIQKIFIECIREWQMPEEYIEKIDSAFNNFYEKILKCVILNPNEFNVLTHGDLWISNAMFRNGVNQEMYFVDFQIPVWLPPAYDLNFFLLTSCNQETRIKEWDSLVEFYYDQLIAALQLLAYNKTLPKLQELRNSMLERGFLCFLTVLEGLPCVLTTLNSGVEIFINADESTNNVRREMFNNEKYVTAMKEILPFLLSRGVFD